MFGGWYTTECGVYTEKEIVKVLPSHGLPSLLDISLIVKTLYMHDNVQYSIQGHANMYAKNPRRES